MGCPKLEMTFSCKSPRFARRSVRREQLGIGLAEEFEEVSEGRGGEAGFEAVGHQGRPLAWTCLIWAHGMVSSGRFGRRKTMPVAFSEVIRPVRLSSRVVVMV